MITGIKHPGNNRLAMHASGKSPIDASGSDEDYVSRSIREITSRLSIYRKLKELGHSDDTIFTIYNKSEKEN
jgi:hypothetical protein